MIYPTINDLSKGEYNRYEIALATAKCARMITNEYAHQREEAESAAAAKETDKPVNALIDKEVRDEKAVKIAIGRIYAGKYHIVHKDPAEQEKAELEILEGLRRKYDEMYEYPSMSFIKDADDDVDDDEAEESAEENFEDISENEEI